MRAPGGGFASSLDADSEHEEGKFYVWTEAEIDAVLGDRAALLQANSTTSRPAGNWEGQHDPQPAASAARWPMPQPKPSSRAAASRLLRGARGAGAARAATTRCWPIGTG